MSINTFALLGAGRTGAKVLDLKNSDQDIIVFNSKKPATLDKLKKCDAIISFLPGQAFLDHIPLLLESGLPVVTGSTGFIWPEHLDERLKSNNQTWIYGRNFALGMNLIQPIIEILGSAERLVDKTDYKMHEVHHANKVDAPSGTALNWQSWLEQKVEISFERRGDVIGEHELTLKTEFEEITIKHKVSDRKSFASGALWAACFLLGNAEQSPGLVNVEDIAQERLNRSLTYNFL